MHRTDGGGAAVRSDLRDDGHHSIVSKLVSLIEHVEAGMEQLEAAIAREAALDNLAVGTNVVVLDDVTPRYVKAKAALTACNAGLGMALLFLMDGRTPGHGAGEFPAGARPPMGSSDRR
jgi:hypothetical protein